MRHMSGLLLERRIRSGGAREASVNCSGENHSSAVGENHSSAVHPNVWSLESGFGVELLYVFRSLAVVFLVAFRK